MGVVRSGLGGRTRSVKGSVGQLLNFELVRDSERMHASAPQRIELYLSEPAPRDQLGTNHMNLVARGPRPTSKYVWHTHVHSAATCTLLTPFLLLARPPLRSSPLSVRTRPRAEHCRLVLNAD